MRVIVLTIMLGLLAGHSVAAANEKAASNKAMMEKSVDSLLLKVVRDADLANDHAALKLDFAKVMKDYCIGQSRELELDLINDEQLVVFKSLSSLCQCVSESKALQDAFIKLGQSIRKNQQVAPGLKAYTKIFSEVRDKCSQ